MVPIGSVSTETKTTDAQAASPTPPDRPPAAKAKTRKPRRLLWILLSALLALLLLALLIFRSVLLSNPRLQQAIYNSSTFFQSGAVGQQFLSFLTGIPANTYDRAAFAPAEQSGRISYAGEPAPLHGIDVSSYQGDIDWEKVRADGIDFAFLRVGLRGWRDSGPIEEDRCFQANLSGAAGVGLPVGVYFFSQAVTTEEAVAEAEFVLARITPEAVRYPVVFDWEPIPDAEARTDPVTGETLTQVCLAFCRRIQEAGYTPMIYGNLQTGLHYFDLGQLSDYDFWLAQYHDYPSFFAGFQVWQYSQEGRVDGIATPVDLNLSFHDYAADE